jgi:hypothetical protein
MMSPIRLDTVHPSWTLGLTSPVTTPPAPAAHVPASETRTEVSEAAPPPAAEPVADPVVRRNIPTGPSNRQRAPLPSSDRRTQAFKPNLPPMQIKRAPWGTKPAAASLPTGSATMSIRSTASVRPQAAPPAELSIRNSAARGSFTIGQDNGHVLLQKADDPSQIKSISEETPLLKRITTSTGEAAIKRKHEQDPVDRTQSSANKTASLASRLGIQVPTAGPNPYDRELDARKKKQRNNQYPSGAQLPHANSFAARPSEPHQKTTNHAERPIPSLLARMRDSGTGRPPSAVNNSLPVTTEPQSRPTSPSVSLKTDGIQRRGRGFAAAGIELASSPVGGFTIRGSTPTSSSRP